MVYTKKLYRLFKKYYDFNDSMFKMFFNLKLENKIIDYDDAIKI